MKYVFLLAAYFFSMHCAANEIDEQRAKYNYQMFCQGCHTPDGMGGEGVPRINGFIGNFLTFPKGREFLVRVPGSAYSPLSNKELAEVLNWMVINFGGDSIPKDFQNYTENEIGALRLKPLNEINNYRKDLLSIIGS